MTRVMVILGGVACFICAASVVGRCNPFTKRGQAGENRFAIASGH